MRVLVCGSRYWNDWPTMVRVLQRHVTSDDTVIHGGCRGADVMAGAVARKEIGCDVRVFMPDWKRFGVAAGPIRNRQMLDEADQVIAFHLEISRSKGTKDTLDEATRRGIPTMLIAELERA